MRLGKSFKIFSGFKINVSRKGISSTISKKGFSINTGSHGTFINTNIPGTGISHRQKITGTTRQKNNNKDSAIEGAILLGGIIGVILLVLFNSMILFLLPIFIVPLIIIFSPEGKNNIQRTAPITNNENTPEVIVNKITIENDNELVPVENMITSLYPNQYGLYPHEILALYLLPDKNNHPKYWFYRYNVQNLPELIQSLIDRNFMIISIPNEKEILEHYKIAELRNLLQQHGIKSHKKKEDIIQAILENIPHNEIKKFISTQQKNINPHYVLTELGQATIKDDEYVLYAHKHNYDEFDIYSLNKVMAGDTKNYKKYIMEIFTKKCAEHLKANQYSSYRNTKSHMSEFLAEEGHILQAIKALAEVIYIDINELSDSNYYPGDDFLNEFYLPVNSLASGIIDRLCEYKEKLNLDNEQLTNILFEVFVYISNYPTFHIFTETECVKITQYAMTNNDKKIEKIHQQAKQRLQEKYPEVTFYD